MFGLHKSTKKASARQQIAIQGVQDGVLELPGRRYRMIVSVSAVNFELREFGVSLSVNYENPTVYVALVEETSIRGIHSPQDVGKYIEMKEKKL